MSEDFYYLQGEGARVVPGGGRGGLEIRKIDRNRIEIETEMGVCCLSTNKNGKETGLD